MAAENLNQTTTNTSNPYSKHSLNLATDHYENFPVLGWLFPKKINLAIKYIYAFARIADDIADEGEMSATLRLQKLDEMEAQLEKIKANQIPDFDLFKGLGNIIKTHQLSLSYFFDLLSAFKQDVTQKQYDSHEAVLDYCKRSANPIGRLLLELMGFDSEYNNQRSDEICTALQLINFWQDIHLDYTQKNRVYIPNTLWLQTHLSPSIIQLQPDENQLINLVIRQLDFAEHLLIQGSKLSHQLSGRFKFYIKLTLLGGYRILKACRQRNNIKQRPVLKKLDWLVMIFKALVFKEISPKRSH